MIIPDIREQMFQTTNQYVTELYGRTCPGLVNKCQQTSMHGRQSTFHTLTLHTLETKTVARQSSSFSKFAGVGYCLFKVIMRHLRKL